MNLFKPKAIKMTSIAIRVTDEEKQVIESYRIDKGYKNTSEFVRALIKKEIEKDSVLKINQDVCPQTECAGTMEIIDNTDNYTKWKCRSCGYIDIVDK